MNCTVTVYQDSQGRQVGIVPERLWAKVDRWDPDECWIWTGTRMRLGYGQFHTAGRAGRMRLAHRVTYELLVGPIPQGMELDHLCRRPSCVNPKHLEPVTHRENVLRGIGLSAVRARQTHCKRGHLFDEANTRTYKGHRTCRTCKREAS